MHTVSFPIRTPVNVNRSRGRAQIHAMRQRTFSIIILPRQPGLSRQLRCRCWAAQSFIKHSSWLARVFLTEPPRRTGLAVHGVGTTRLSLQPVTDSNNVVPLAATGSVWPWRPSSVETLGPELLDLDWYRHQRQNHSRHRTSTTLGTRSLGVHDGHGDGVAEGVAEGHGVLAEM